MIDKAELRTLADLAKDPTLHPWYRDLIAEELRAAEDADILELRAAEEILHPDMTSISEALRRVAAATAAPDPYAVGIAAMRAAAAPPESTFEDKWKAERMAEAMATRAALDAHIPESRIVTLSVADRFPAPDPYAAGIAALRAKETR